MEKTLLDITWVLISAGLVFMMQAGFLCLETGLTRTKNAINVAIKNVTDFSISVFLYWLFGFAIMFGVTHNGWFGTTYFLAETGQGEAWFASFFIFQAMFCATAATIVSGAIAERIRFSAYVIITIVISGLIYPFFGHWVWGGTFGDGSGWLAQRGFVDFAGSTVVHSVGGWVALAVLLIIGPRNGRFSANETPKKIPGSNLPMALLGVLILFFGWIGFNGGSTLAMNEKVPGIIANTVLAGVAGGISMLAIGWRLRGIPDVIFPMNGALAGLVAITANCFAVSALSAVIIGAVGGLIAYMIEALLERLKIDDVIGAVPVHMGAGVWGTLAVALFGQPEILGTGLSVWKQFQVQLLGVTVCFLYAFTTAFMLFFIINRFFPLRVTEEQEFQGLNVAEHNATTELADLLNAMDYQSKTKDMDFKVPVEPFTEVGQIAQKYNHVMGKLKMSVTKTDTIVNNIHEGIITFTAEGLLTSMNSAGERMFKFSFEEVQNQSVANLFTSFDQDRENSLAFIGDFTLDMLLDKRVEMDGIRKDGSKFPVELTVTIAHVDGFDFYTGIIRDITERRKIENDLKKKMTELEEFKKMSVGRENKMIDLKKEINDLSKELGKAEPYDLSGLDKAS